MTNTIEEIYQKTLQDLQRVNPVYGIYATMPGDEKYVFLIEACNDAAKVARAKFKELRDAAKASGEDLTEAKEFDRISSALMKTAKCTMIPLALAAGAKAYAAMDDAGQPVLILEHPKAGRVALHNVSPAYFPDDVRESIEQAPGPLFTGFHRQRLASVTAQAIKNNDTLFLKGIIEASWNQDYAAKVFARLGGQAAANTASTESLRAVFTSLTGIGTLPVTQIPLSATTAPSATLRAIRSSPAVGPSGARLTHFNNH